MQLVIWYASCCKRQASFKYRSNENKKVFKKRSKKMTKNAWQVNRRCAKIKRLSPTKETATRTVVRSMQIKNRIRKKRFFVTQKAVSVNFFETSVLKAKSARITNIVRAVGTISLVSALNNWTQEFDSGSGWTLAACLTHASRTDVRSLLLTLVADGWVTREQSAHVRGITVRNDC